MAVGVAIAVVSMIHPAALADHPEETAQTGPILSIDQVILLIRSAQPNTEVDEIKIENRGEMGLIYRVKLTDKTRIDVNAYTGEILESDD